MYPLGASYDGAGVNFALFSQVAERVELCLFDDQDNESRIELTEQNSYVWHTYLPESSQGNAMAIASTGRTIRSRGSGATRTSCCSTRTRRP